jgi:DNA-damage-inducible protein J
MAATAFVRARIDETLKVEATAVLAEMGLTVSDVVRIVLTKVAKEKALPFEMRVPNKLTAATLAKSERDEDVHHAKDANDLFGQLGIWAFSAPSRLLRPIQARREAVAKARQGHGQAQGLAGLVDGRSATACTLSRPPVERRVAGIS